MGDRVSISFKTGREESVVLFNHWGGKAFSQYALEYAKKLMATRTGHFEPIDRFEPRTVLVDFIRELTKRMMSLKRSNWRQV